MTYQPNCTLPKELLEQISAAGSEALPELIRVLIDEAMRLEREQHLGAGPYKRTPVTCSPVRALTVQHVFDS